MSAAELNDTDHVLLGFYIANSVIWLVASLAWPHFIRYFLIFGPPYSPKWAAVVRVLFGIWFLSSLWGALRLAVTTHPFIADLGSSLAYAAMITTVFWVMDAILSLFYRRAERLLGRLGYSLLILIGASLLLSSLSYGWTSAYLAQVTAWWVWVLLFGAVGIGAVLTRIGIRGLASGPSSETIR